MSDLSGRLVNVARAYLNAAKDRLSEIDATAQEELSRAMTFDDIPGTSSVSVSSDPMERARAKIAAAQNTAAAQREMATAGSSPAAPAPAPLTTDPVQTAYKVLGLPADSDYAAVQEAVSRLRERCAPSKFPDGSTEQGEAQTILQKVEESHQVLKASLNAGDSRFDKLEL